MSMDTCSPLMHLKPTPLGEAKKMIGLDISREHTIAPSRAPIMLEPLVDIALMPSGVMMSTLHRALVP